MKRVLALSAGLLLITGLIASVQAAEAKSKEDARKAKMAELLKQYDKNNDGKIDDAEEEVIRADRKKAEEAKKAAVLSELVKKYDKNGNGKIDDDEEEAIRADRLKQKQQKEAK